MASIYENSDFIFSTTDSGEKYSQSKGQEEVTSSKWTKVFGISLVFALGGLCVLGIMYNNKRSDFELLNEQQHNTSMQLSAQQNYSAIMERKFEKLTSRYKSLREWLSFYDAQSCNLSVNGWMVCREKVYFFSTDKRSWSNSRNVCISKQADLVTISSKVEQDFLVSKIDETHWIGLTDLDTEGHWVWVNNQTLKDTGVQFWTKRHFGNSEPDNWRHEDPSGENCASLGNIDGNLKTWFDNSCNKKKKFICEKKNPFPFTDDNN
ncbi:CD209 antigen-like protein E [Chanodichthys erythropterus]|uniref:CD209 antigen-like protein E n=1 Tax=Chanodichthys erythropterus TaxID=933992 RepID=UPI00351DC218